MNERLRQFAEQATRVTEPDDADYRHETFDKAKFAELIIKDQQRPWIGLTDEEIKEIWLTGIDRGDDWLDVQGIARAIEDTLRRKNT